MDSQSVEIIKTAVLILGLSTLGASIAIFLFMEFHFRRQQARQVRRLILASRLSPSPEEADPEVSWSHSSRADQEIILDILVDQSVSADAKWRNAIRLTVIGLGVYDQWISELHRSSVAYKVRAAKRLGAIHDSRGVQALNGAARDPSRRVRLAVALALGRLKDPEGIHGLIRVAQHPVRAVPDLTLAAALAACAEGKPALLNDLLRSTEPRLRIMATWALSEVADRTVLEPLLDITGDPDPEVRGKSARALARIHDRGAVAALMRLARDPVWFVRVRALDALGELGDPEGEAAALHGLEDPVREVRYRAAFALRLILGMKGEIAAKVLATASRRGFNSLVSEWDRAGFLWQVVAGLSTRDWARFQESIMTTRILIEAGVTHSLAYFMVVYPDIKIRIRLARLFAESASSRARAELAAVVEQPMCQALVAAEIGRLLAPNRANPGVRREGLPR
jgi:HEAT repeats